MNIIKRLTIQWHIIHKGGLEVHSSLVGLPDFKSGVGR